MLFEVLQKPLEANVLQSTKQICNKIAGERKTTYCAYPECKGTKTEENIRKKLSKMTDTTNHFIIFISLDLLL